MNTVKIKINSCCFICLEVKRKCERSEILAKKVNIEVNLKPNERRNRIHEIWHDMFPYEYKVNQIFWIYSQVMYVMMSKLWFEEAPNLHGFRDVFKGLANVMLFSCNRKRSPYYSPCCWNFNFRFSHKFAAIFSETINNRTFLICTID